MKKFNLETATRDEIEDAIRSGKKTYKRWSKTARKSMLAKENAKPINWHNIRMNERDNWGLKVREGLLSHIGELEIVTVTVADDTGFDGGEYTPKLENVKKWFDVTMEHVDLWNNLDKVKGTYAFFGEESNTKRGHIHGICDSETADKVQAVWEGINTKGYIWRKEVGSLLNASRYIAKHGYLMQASFNFA